MLNTKHTKRHWWLTASFVLAATAMLTTSCGDNDTALPINEVQPDTPAQTYTANIPATIGGKSLTKAVAISGTTATGTFQTKENIYVYNATKKAMLEGALHPADISADGKQCSLAGSLTGTIDDGDKLTLLYNLNYYSAFPTSCHFVYDSQNGTESGLIDGGIATGIKATLSNGVLSCESPAVFDLAQSVFRFKFQDNEGHAINVKTVRIESYAIATSYYPLEEEDDQYSNFQVFVTPASATTDYLYVSLCIDESHKDVAFEFTVTDAYANQYTGTKDAPSDGFANGKFYYNSSAISLKKQATLVKPTVAWTSVEFGQAVEPDKNGTYSVWGPYENGANKPSEITISGTSIGYRFVMKKGATVTLNNLTATRDETNFIGSIEDVNLVVNGSNTINCSQTNFAIDIDGTLKISGNGTLTVTTRGNVLGLYAQSNYNKYQNNTDPSNLAAEGHTVTRSDVTQNSDGTRTWTYTVKPK